ncbi:diacylglycerol/lipid kinase family protein [Actinophytocola gossypii]|uniref:NAD(+)/NADH kinase n=1 Tax=Actinophytocola gossypii TaxID=2812003 RepID=A0ABT2JII5_9PSEU|nr:diacylglycerol kinase family protein [Actinophytocola gossypii]MCT2587692.1 NAD(+)/NADH kinase [Actinophytocola gossypii]
MRIALVANQLSGSGRTDTAVVRRHLEDYGADVTVVPLDEVDGPLPAGLDRIVVAGGDGSIGVAARAANRAGLPLAVLPTGTANDFATALGLPRELATACLLAADKDAEVEHREVGLVGDLPFVNAAAAGLSAVANRLATPHKARLGALAYAVGAVRAGVTAPHLRCRVRRDGETVFTGDAWQVVVAVTGAFGGGSNIGGTRRDDHRLDVAVVPAGSRLKLVRIGYHMRRGMLTHLDDVPHHRGAEIEVELPARREFNVDGELRHLDPARFTLLDGGVDVVVPSRR